MLSLRMADLAREPSSREPPDSGDDDPPSLPVGTGIRRTYLAQERTYLAWLRSGLTAFAVSLGAGKIVPAVAHKTEWPYAALGAGFALLGIACVVYGFLRERVVSQAIGEGRFVKVDRWFSTVLAGAAVLLGVATAILVSS